MTATDESPLAGMADELRRRPHGDLEAAQLLLDVTGDPTAARRRLKDAAHWKLGLRYGEVILALPADERARLVESLHDEQQMVVRRKTTMSSRNMFTLGAWHVVAAAISAEAGVDR